MAGMALHTFHSTSSSLPDLANDGWKKLLAPLPAGEAQAAVLLSTPDNSQVYVRDPNVHQTASSCACPAALLHCPQCAL